MSDLVESGGVLWTPGPREQVLRTHVWHALGARGGCPCNSGSHAGLSPLEGGFLSQAGSVPKGEGDQIRLVLERDGMQAARCFHTHWEGWGGGATSEWPPRFLEVAAANATGVPPGTWPRHCRTRPGQAAASLSHPNSLGLCLVEPHLHWNSDCRGVWETVSAPRPCRPGRKGTA